MKGTIVGIAAGALISLFVVAVAPANAGSFVNGVDVSHWQGFIDWKAVAGSGTRFVIAKATEGQTYDDPNYSSYKSGATNARLKFGAYHFARPDTTYNDATIEANHFVDVARLHIGNLIPALDLEAGRELSVSQLVSWTRVWLSQVRSRLGVKPMIYASPSFWRDEMGDTTEFARAGYKVLWVAHWGVDSPTVPAHNWDGNGWTFWQWTGCGKVRGIDGCVDRDRYKTKNFWPVTIH